ncbi:GNAT family N-acetyltransferase [Brevibacillus daliensis]|uniref:GNAT family N-acetyltransferase n=1 Tax=Brevibacillus daliensis TaxID=2892995 RepID=UPI0028150CAB|nr:GNAT family N-acetyltransferase [Brevibacillus daliensis]
MFETDRLKLRQMDENDEDNLMRIFSDPIAMQYYPSTKTKEQAQSWIKWNLKNYENNDVGLWICELKENGAYVGQCGIVPQIVNEQQEMEVGYLFVREFWGRGLATEAARASRDFGFTKLGLPRLISMIYKPNLPSIKVAERIGMTFEKETLIKNRETLIYSICK